MAVFTLLTEAKSRMRANFYFYLKTYAYVIYWFDMG